MKCKATNDCEREAEYTLHGIKTCRTCLEEHIKDDLLDEAISDWIDMNAFKIHK